MENLFDKPTTLRDPKHFVGRRGELERIFGLIKARQSVALVGPRRIGKTSLLTYARSQEVQQKCNFDSNSFLFIYVDLQKRAMKKVGFFDYICRMLKEQCQNLGRVVDDELVNDDLFDALLDEFQQLELHPVLMMDAFDEIMNWPIDESVFSFLRSEGGEGKISYITASMEAPTEIFRKFLPAHLKATSPFYNIFATIRLQAFSLEEAQQLLFDTSDRSGLPFNKDEVNWTIQQAGTHPYLLQQVATLLFEAKRSSSSKRIDYRHIQNEVQKNLFSHFEDAWDMLATNDRQLLLKKFELEIANSVDLLDEEDEEPQENHANYICPEFERSALFHKYLQDTGKLIESPLNKITADDFKNILANLNDPGELGLSELTKVPFITAQIEKQQAIAPTLRGKIIRDILEEAFEKMKGQGERTNSARGWIHYNILYYRYFMLRHSMNQSKVAEQLGFSERQYYRFFSQALKRLRNELHAMDAEATFKHRDQTNKDISPGNF